MDPADKDLYFMNGFCEIETVCVQGGLNWPFMIVAIPLFLLTIGVIGFCGIMLMNALRSYLGRIVAIFQKGQNADKK